jgi:hypothetical protein
LGRPKPTPQAEQPGPEPTKLPFRIKRPWRLEKVELERKHNQREERGKRLAHDLSQVPPKLYE